MPTLVLLPGMDGTGQLFSDFVTALGRDFESIIVAYPGELPLDYKELETLVRERLPLDRPYVLLGESFSGPIAVSIAASAPVGLHGLVLCCSFVKNPRPWLGILKALVPIVPVRAIPTWILSRVLLGRYATLENTLALRRALTGVSPSAIRTRLRSVLGVDVAQLLSRVKVPVLYLRASEDRLVPEHSVQLVSHILPATKVVEVKAPHLLLQAAAMVAAQDVRRFINESVGL